MILSRFRFPRPWSLPSSRHAARLPLNAFSPSALPQPAMRLDVRLQECAARDELADALRVPTRSRRAGPGASLVGSGRRRLPTDKPRIEGKRDNKPCLMWTRCDLREPPTKFRSMPGCTIFAGRRNNVHSSAESAGAETLSTRLALPCPAAVRKCGKIQTICFRRGQNGTAAARDGGAPGPKIGGVFRS